MRKRSFSCGAHGQSCGSAVHGVRSITLRIGGGLWSLRGSDDGRAKQKLGLETTVLHVAIIRRAVFKADDQLGETPIIPWLPPF